MYYRCMNCIGRIWSWKEKLETLFTDGISNTKMTNNLVQHKSTVQYNNVVKFSIFLDSRIPNFLFGLFSFSINTIGLCEGPSCRPVLEDPTAVTLTRYLAGFTIGPLAELILQLKEHNTYVCTSIAIDHTKNPSVWYECKLSGSLKYGRVINLTSKDA